MKLSIINLVLLFSVCVTFLLNYYTVGIQYAPEYVSTFFMACLSFCHSKEMLKINIFFILKSRIIYFLEVLNCLALIYWSFSLLYLKESFISYFSLSIAIISIFVATRKSFKNDDFDYIIITDRNFENWKTFHCNDLSCLNNRAILVVDDDTPNSLINFFRGKSSNNGVAYRSIHHTTNLNLFEQLLNDPNSPLRYPTDGIVSSILCLSTKNFIKFYTRLPQLTFKNSLLADFIKRDIIVYTDSLNSLQQLYLALLRSNDTVQHINFIITKLSSDHFKFKAGDFLFDLKIMVHKNSIESHHVKLTRLIKF